MLLRLKGLFWAFLTLFATVSSEILSLDESLREGQDLFIINRDSGGKVLDLLPAHHIQKRSIVTHDNITAKIERLNDNHQQLLVHWTGKSSNVFICLARNSWDQLMPLRPPAPSAVYISYDSGTTYLNRTDSFKMDNNTYASVDKFSNHPRSQNFMVFVDQYNKMLYLTQDFGENIKRIKPHFQPIDVSFYPEDPRIFLVHDVNKTLWITRDFGDTFSVAQEFVKAYSWVDRWPGTWTDTPTRSLLVQRIEPYSGSTLIALGNLVISDEPNITVEMRNIEEFTKVGDFVFVTRKMSVNHNELYISYKGGDFFKALFGSEYKNSNYHVVDVSEVRLLVAVAHNETLSNLYVSEVVPNSAYYFRLSLERLFCYFPDKTWNSSWLSDVTEEKFADIHKVKGMRGIYLASQVTKSARSVNLNPEHLQTLITFDWGAEWKLITPPSVNEVGRPIIGCDVSAGCTLHLTQKFMSLYPYAKTIPILSSASAPGLIVATGVLGTSLKGPTGIFVSRDAGLTWKKVLRDDYMFNFGDHGGIMAAVKYFKANATQDLLYSTDEGESWKSFTFIQDSIRVYNLMTEPGENTTTFTLFGSEVKKHGWIIITIDLRNAFKYNCTKEDYKPWSPSGGLKEHKTKSVCILGLQEVYERRISHSNCYNGRDYDRPIRKEPCPCDIEDFECDFGFMRHTASSGCIRNKSLDYDPYRLPESCKPGQFYNRTKGYRKIDGDACFGGYAWQYLPDTIPCPFNETSHFLLVSVKNKILRFNLAESTQPKREVLPVHDLSNVIAIDFDMKENCLYYGDAQKDIIARQCLSGKAAPEILVESGLKSVEGLAFDWISKLLYFVDGQTTKIEVIRTDINYSNRMRKTILDNSTLEKPRGIALHPVAGYMFWTDWSMLKPHIGRSNLNGSDVRVLFTSPLVSWPNGITVDHIAELIYWVDAKLDYIAAANLHGQHFRKIIKSEPSNKRLAHPFSVAVFKDLVYWDDWERRRIFYSDKDHGLIIYNLTQEYEGLMDLKVFAHSLQEGSNGCSNSSAVCSHLCFAQPDRLPPVCACPDSMVLQAGECRCLDGSPPFANHTCPNKDKSCVEGEVLCGNNRSCIPLSWRCNGFNDCGDNSDEMDCSFQTCKADEYRCRNGHCIPKYWVCDRDSDCVGGDDEFNCSVKTCGKEQFQCNTKECISKKWRCDGEADCRDGSDELNCKANSTGTPVNCTENKQFRCNDGLFCINENWVCDGVFDCQDHSDEVNCTKPQDCDAAQFQCEKSKRCIYKLWQCDGDLDCGEGDRSDEENCTRLATTTLKPELFAHCKEFMFKCPDDRCIPEWWKCDGVPDCTGGADEVGCHQSVRPPRPPDSSSPLPTTSPTPPHVFRCKDNEFQCGSGDCIPSAWTCDGNNDCSDNSDEANCSRGGGGVECPAGYLRCHFSNSCYHSRQACDGAYDCPDYSDERDCANKASASSDSEGESCPIGYFKCPEGLCYALSKKCDGHRDCMDGADESNCKSFQRIYQVDRIELEMELTWNASVLPVSWSVEKVATGVRLEYLPSIALVPAGSRPGTGQLWRNHTEWLTSREHVFTSLRPYTQYNVTVYARVAGRNTVFPPAVYVVFRTPEDVPSPPWNITVSQKSGDIAEVRWSQPLRPNGLITEYHLYSTPPLPPLMTVVVPRLNAPSYHAYISTHFEPGAQYSFWVVAVNSAGVSNNSQVASLLSEQADVGPVKNVAIQCANVSLCRMSWEPAKGAAGYRIQVSSFHPYPKIQPILTAGPPYQFESLAPGASYRISINGYNKTFEGQPSVSSLTTSGPELPIVKDINTKIEKKMDGYSVTMTWRAPKSDHYQEKWTYGVYYGTSTNELFDGPKIKTQDLNATVDQLEACETYLLDVGVVGPLGYGPLSTSPARLTTGYHRSAPPKGLTLSRDPHNETIMIISWNSSCFEMKEPIGYIINVEETVTGQKQPLTLLPSVATSMQHKIIVDYGARYKVSVQTNVNGSVVSSPVEHWAPLLPAPSQVRLEHYPSNSAYLITWQLHSPLHQLPKHDFEVLVCEGSEFDEKQAVVHKVKSPPYIISDLQRDSVYWVAVRLVSQAGYTSSLSELNEIRLTPSEFSMVVEGGGGGASVASVFLLVFAGVFVLLLAIVFGIYAVKHHRLRNSFAAFANSHYSTSSGAAIFTDRLDDEDSPVIRGFSDDEPLVVA